MPSNGTEARQRLFFALWPDDAVRSALARSMRDLLGKRIRLVPEANLHITLAFVGPASAQLRDCLAEAAAGIRGAPFELTLDHVGHWPRPRILWLGPTHTPPALWSLVEGVNRTFDACGLARERRPWQAHMTLARRISRPPPRTGFEPVAWSIGDFCLVESVSDAQGARYRRLLSWPLADG